MKVIVLGVGSMGAAACHSLARGGAEVVGFEQFETPHERGSHHGGPRMIRQSYYEHPDYVPLLRRAYALWRELEQRTDSRILDQTGGLYMGPADAEIVAGALRSAREHGLPFELLDAESLRGRYPQFRLPANHVGFHEARAGFVYPDRALAAMLIEARRHGAEIVSNQKVLSWKAGSSGIVVRTAAATHHADRLVVTAGAWAGGILADLGIPFKVTRQVLAWYRPKQDRASEFTADRFPCWFLETDPPFGYYGFPLAEDTGLVKFALHKPGIPADPDAAVRDPVTLDESAALRGFLDDYLPGACERIESTRTCLYTHSPDHHFVLGAHPLHERVLIAAGFSGHGFKFAPVIGEALAELALHGRYRLPVGFLSPGRLV